MPGHEAEIEYLRSIMVPVLIKGLTQMCKLKPEAPYKWFAEFLLKEQEAGTAGGSGAAASGEVDASRRPPSRRGSFVAKDGLSWSQADGQAAPADAASHGPVKEFHVMSVMTQKHLDDVKHDPETAQPVLGDNVMKSDHFANIWKLDVKFEGVPNFRKVDAMPVYGVAQPVEKGIGSVADHILTNDACKRILWFNMRNEPICYVNGRPNAPRTKGHLNDNVENPGISVFDLEEMEARLRQDIVDGSAVQNGIFLFYHQAKDMTNEAKWEHVDKDQVKTLRQIYDDMQKDKPVDYIRLPILDEKAPDNVVLDELVKLLEDVDPDVALVFNCQMGRGRTTTGMVSACLIWRAVNKKEPEGVHAPIDAENPNLVNGEFKIVIELVNKLGERGLKVKQQVDEVMDACYHMQNLRTAIEECKREADKASAPGAVVAEGRSADFWLKRGVNYLERYFMLIAFAAYLDEVILAGQKSSDKLFSAWYGEHPEIDALLKQAALE